MSRHIEIHQPSLLVTSAVVWVVGLAVGILLKDGLMPALSTLVALLLIVASVGAKK